MTAASDSKKIDFSSDLKPVGQDGPVVVDLGKKSRKQIKRLRNGKGKLLAEVNGCIQELKSSGTISTSAQPVVVVIRQKRNAKRLMAPYF